MKNPIFIKTRKSDSKGRLIGFPPNTSFEVQQRGDEYTCYPADRTQQFVPKPATGEGISYLESFDLNPRMIARDSADETGYDEFQFDAKGSLIYLFGKPYTIRKPWPEGFDWAHFVQVSLVYRGEGE